MSAGQYDFRFIAGNTLNFSIRLRGFDGTGSSFKFIVKPLLEETISPAAPVVMVIEDDPDGGKMTTLDWSLTPAQGRKLWVGRSNNYELERRIGGNEETVLVGNIIMSAGVNTDD